MGRARDIKTSFVPGNQIWKLVKNPGKKPIIESPEILWELAVSYFTWTEQNPIVISQIHGKHSEIVTIEKPQPYSMYGFMISSGVTKEMVFDYKKMPGYGEVMHEIENIIHKQKFDLACLGVYNANVIIRDLGLADKRQVETTDNKKVVLYLPDNGRSIAPPKDISVVLNIPEIPEPESLDADFDSFDDFEAM